MAVNILKMAYYCYKCIVFIFIQEEKFLGLETNDILYNFTEDIVLKMN